jgi:hypothetical protein
MSTAASDSTSSSDSMTTAEINTSTIDSNRPPDGMLKRHVFIENFLMSFEFHQDRVGGY